MSFEVWLRGGYYRDSFIESARIVDTVNKSLIGDFENKQCVL